jgi:GTP-binding protein EngB required for normal cell division
VSARDSEAPLAVWKSYVECLLEDVQILRKFRDAEFSGLFDVARVASFDVLRAARGVTKRFLGFESCLNQLAMEEDKARKALEAEKIKCAAVEVVRERLRELGFETMSDPDAFLHFLQHDPVQAFDVVPAICQTYLEAEPPQRVLLFAKLLGLVAMAGALLNGEAKVAAAFDSFFPVNEDGDFNTGLTSTTLALAGGSGGGGSLSSLTNCSSQEAAAKEAHAHRVMSLVRQQRLQLARTRLLIVAGAPDVGKTTILREVFGLKHLVAGLGQEGRTEQVDFELHPSGDDQLRPIYLVDTPGYGDGELLHRNDMGRILLGAGKWLPGGVILLWVVQAGRNVRKEADELLRGMVANLGLTLLVVVTHVDRLFEDRYREVGPQWRDGPLQGVPHKDPQWEERRRLLMAELKDEIVAGIRSAVRGAEPASGIGAGGSADKGGDREDDTLKLEFRFTCLGGWMATDSEEDEDEFKPPPPWPWAKREVSDFFEVLDRRSARQWLDTRIGL